MKLINHIFIFVALVVFSCVKDKPNEIFQPEVTFGNGSRVFIINEGNYGSNNASVSMYQLSNGQIVSDIYKTQNNNAVLGDVCQSLNKINNKFYVVVNNSGKIAVVNTGDFKLITAITGLQSPRFILPVTFSKAYVSDLYSNSISIIDLNTNTKTGSIPCNGWTERMALIYNRAFVTNPKSNYTYVINTITDQITDSINVGPFAGSIVTDKNSKIWILSAGSSTASANGKLTRINPVNLQVELSLGFSSTAFPSNLCINATKDTIYFLNTNIYRMDVNSTTLPSSAFISSSSNNFYGLDISDKDYNIYVSDAIDYIQKSSVIVYSPSGQLRTSFKAGINASGFYFE